jgi:uncharacterized Ntn-hydrolase superfamily protein
MYIRLTLQERTDLAERLIRLFAAQNVHPGDAATVLTTAIWILDRENEVDIETSVDMFRQGLTALHGLEVVQ